MRQPTTIGDFRRLAEAAGRSAVRELVRERAKARADDNVFIDFDEAAFDAAFAGPVMAGPLADVPYVVKDNIDALPFATTGGSPIFAGAVPASDAPAVARIRDAGGVLIGKVNMHELAFGVTGNNAHYGVVRNPYDNRRVAGGSSGGTAAAVALGIAPFGLGSDTGGSVRMPAAFCGVVGFRPSAGRYPGEGVLILSTTRDTIGVIARSVGDATTVDGVVTGDGGVGSIPRRPRFGVLDNAQPGLSQAVDKATGRALGRLARAGCELVRIDSRALHEIDKSIEATIAVFEVAERWSRLSQSRLGVNLAELAERIASPDVRAIFRRLAAGKQGLGDDYAAAMNDTRPRLQAAYRDIFEEYDIDALVTVSVPVPPPHIGEDHMMVVDGRELDTFDVITHNASMAPVVGSPSLSVPAGLDDDGLPVGLQFECRPGDDRRLLAIGGAVEASLFWEGR
jgi:mandelamide amidase